MKQLWLLGLAVLLWYPKALWPQNPPPLVQGGTVKVSVHEFTIEGTPGFLITPDILTATLVERVRHPFEILQNPSEEPADLTLKGSCVLHQDHTLDLSLTLISRFGDTLKKAYSQLTIDQAQDTVARFLAQSVDTLTILTEPKGALARLDGVTLGAAPLRYFPVIRGTHKVEANFGGPKGLVSKTIRFPDTRVVVLKSPLLTQKPKTAKILFEGDEPAEIWLNGKKLGMSDQGWIDVPPGKHTFEIVSPAFGTRTVTLSVEAGRRYKVKY